MSGKSCKSCLRGLPSHVTAANFLDLQLHWADVIRLLGEAYAQRLRPESFRIVWSMWNTWAMGMWRGMARPHSTSPGKMVIISSPSFGSMALLEEACPLG